MTKYIYILKSENIVSENANTSTTVDMFVLVCLYVYVSACMKKNTHFKNNTFLKMHTGKRLKNIHQNTVLGLL